MPSVSPRGATTGLDHEGDFPPRPDLVAIYQSIHIRESLAAGHPSEPGKQAFRRSGGNAVGQRASGMGHPLAVGPVEKPPSHSSLRPLEIPTAKASTEGDFRSV